jgi:hypothetical protein
MHSVTSFRGACPSAPLGAAVAALLALLLPDGATAAGCPWIVQPHAQLASATADTEPGYDIVFDGLYQERLVFYGFTVADLDLAWRLTSPGDLPQLQEHGRALQANEQADGTAYKIAADTIQPHTIYLVAAPREIAQFEAIGARIEPDRPVAVSMKTRGGSDMSGPLPHRSLPGVEVKAAAEQDAAQVVAQADPPLQICAYQVALR